MWMSPTAVSALVGEPTLRQPLARDAPPVQHWVYSHGSLSLEFNSGHVRCLILAACFAACVTAAHAEAQVWGEIELPGGVTASRQVLGLGTKTRTSSAFLLDFIRTFDQFSDIDSTAIGSFERYLCYVQELRAVLPVWPDGMQLG